MKVWNYKNADKQLAVELSKECGIDTLTALLLVSKGFCDPMEIDEFLSDDVSLCDPYSFADMDIAVERILKAVDKFEAIAIYGDYDCDGVTSVTLLYSVLSEMGANVQWRVPSRDDGYGISIAAIDVLKENEINLIITVDNGISAFEAIDYANENNIDVIVCDHHIPGETLPKAYAVIDPKRKDCFSEFKDYAGVGVAFMLCCALTQMPCDEMLYQYGDIVALGTIADVMPLKYDNRTIVKQGLNVINRLPRLGIKALADVSGLKNGSITSMNIAFGLAPRINASGRILHPKKAVELLLCDNEDDAQEIAEELKNANALRQKIETEIFEQALEMLENVRKMINAPVIVVQGEGWHHGIIGIVAAKLCEIFSRPAIVFSVQGNEAVGSCRSFDGVSIYDILAGADSIKKFGGHESAAGLTVESDLLEKAICSIELSAKRLYPNLGFDKIDISFKLNPNALSLSNVYSQRILEPFGNCNELPLYALCNMVIKDIIELSGGKHLRLIVSRENDATRIPIMRFFCSKSEFIYPIGTKVDIAVTLDNNIYKGNEQLSIIAKDIKPCEYDIDTRLERIRMYQNFKYFGDMPNISSITRDDVAFVYKTIKRQKVINVDERGLAFVFKSVDYCKTRIILDILEELSFVDLDIDKCLRIHFTENAKNCELSNSKIYRMFNSESGDN